MKKFLAIGAGTVILFVAACSSIPVDAGSLMHAGSAVQTAAQQAEGKEFKSGEVLCADGVGNDAVDMYYFVAKVMTPASAATKNQAEVLFVNNGNKDWSSFVIPTHKATKAELAVGRLAFHMDSWNDADEKNVSAETYRQSRWEVGRITSTDEMFKNMVEIDGTKWDWRLVRIADAPLE